MFYIYQIDADGRDALVVRLSPPPLAVSFSPSLCEITVAIGTQQIGLEVATLEAAMATAPRLSSAPLVPSACVGWARADAALAIGPRAAARDDGPLRKR